MTSLTNRIAAVQACLNGSRSPAEHPAVPVTAAERQQPLRIARVLLRLQGCQPRPRIADDRAALTLREDLVRS